METETHEIVHRTVVHRIIVTYACGCTTTRITVRRAAEGEAAPSLFAAHHGTVVEEEESWEYGDYELVDRD